MKDDLVLVYTAYNPMEAKAIAGNLESRGIKVVTRQEPAGSAIGITIGALGEIELYVREENYTDATAILDLDTEDDPDGE
jgi:hypothetical protein